MSRKKTANNKDLNAQNDVSFLSEVNREDKIMNSMANISILLMSTMMGAFTQVIVNATGSLASGLAEVMGGKEGGDKANEEIKENLPEVDKKTQEIISDIKKDIYGQMDQKKQEMERLLSDPSFEIGPKIIERYNFKLPRLTQKLDDNVLAEYSQLLTSGDTRFAKMFKELTEWLNSLPKPSETKHQEIGN